MSLQVEAMNKNRPYPRQRGIKPKKRSPELIEKMRYNTIINDEKIKFYTSVETRDTYLVQDLLKLMETRAK